MTDILGGVETFIYNVIKNADRKQFCFDFLVIGSKTKSVFEKELNGIFADGVNHFYYAPPMKKKFIYTNKWLKSFYDAHDYDIIYLNTTTAARIMYCRYAIKRKGVKLVAHSHQGNAISIKGGLGNIIYRHYLTKNSCKRFACSEKAYKWLYDDAPLPQNIIPNGIDTNKFVYSQEDRKVLRKDFGVNNGQIVIGHVGRWNAQKNQSYFISLSKVLGDDYLFLCIGNGPDRENFEAAIKSNGVAKRFILIDARDDVFRYYSAMDIFAMPSLYEGLPIVAVEAQCSGMPCVLSDRISKQTNISDKCIFIPLEKLDEWRKTILGMDLTRYDGKSILESKGYSIKDTVRLLESVFIKI